MSDNIEQATQDVSESPHEGAAASLQIPRRAGRSREARITGYIIAILVNVAFWYLVGNLAAWDVPFITNDFVLVVGALQLSIGAAILGNAVLVTYDPPWFRHVVQIVLSAFALRATYALYQVFPFRSGIGLDPLLRIALLVAMVGTGIAILVEVVQLISTSWTRE
jgi:hypothetical protein